MFLLYKREIPYLTKITSSKPLANYLGNVLVPNGNHGTTSPLTRRECSFSGLGGEHINFFVRLTGWLSRGQPGPHQSKRIMFMGFSLSLRKVLCLECFSVILLGFLDIKERSDQGRERETPPHTNSCFLHAFDYLFLKSCVAKLECAKSLERLFKNEKAAQRGSFRPGYPAEIRGSFARISRLKTSVTAL